MPRYLVCTLVRTLYTRMLTPRSIRAEHGRVHAALLHGRVPRLARPVLTWQVGAPKARTHTAVHSPPTPRQVPRPREKSCAGSPSSRRLRAKPRRNSHTAGANRMPPRCVSTQALLCTVGASVRHRASIRAKLGRRQAKGAVTKTLTDGGLRGSRELPDASRCVRWYREHVREHWSVARRQRARRAIPSGSNTKSPPWRGAGCRTRCTYMG